MEATPNNTTTRGYGHLLSAKASTRTPTRRAISAEPPSSRRAVHTPLDRSVSRDLANSIRRGASASGGRRSNAPTPHAKAARRALDQRRNAVFTPGKNRRRSLREQRETPRDILRNLGRALAPTSKPIVSSSSPRDMPKFVETIPEEDDDDDELPIDRPRFSLPLDPDDDDSDLVPPRSSGLEDENNTVRSIELPRRAISEQPSASRLSRGSFGSVRVSDYFNSEDATDDVGQQSDFFPGLLDDLRARAGAADFTYDRIDADPTRRTTMGRESDFGLQLPPGVDDQTTFMMSEPADDLLATSPIIERSLVEAGAADAGEQFGNVTFTGDEPDMMNFDDAAGDDSPVEDISSTTVELSRPKQLHQARKKQRRVSKHGTEYPALPPAFVKRVAQTALQSSGLSNPRVSADTLTALTQASEWFFEQLGDDLGAYASHAKRKTIEESDVVTLMRRQRQVGSDSTMFSLAQKHLPRELLQELRMPVPQPVKKRCATKRIRADDDEEAADIT